MREKIVKHLIIPSIIFGIILTGNGWAQFHPARCLGQMAGVEPVRVQVGGTGNTIRLDYQVPAATFTSRGETITCCASPRDVTGVSIGNAPPLGSEGKPVLPVIPATVIIPAGKEIDNITVTRSGEVQHAGEYFIEYGAKQLPISCDNFDSETTCDCAVYTSDNPYPSDDYQLLSVQKKHGVAFAYVNLYPVVYQPLSEKVISYSGISLEITLRDASEPVCSEIVIHPERINVTTLPVENPVALAGYYDIACTRPPDRSVPPGYCSPDDTYEYVIVTSEDIKNASTTPNINDLLNDRLDRGLTARIETIEDIKANFPGQDPAEQLRNFIKDAYNNWETEYVLLGGDVGIVPMRTLWVHINSTFQENIPSDLYYQCLDGSYNKNGNDMWGEIEEDAETGNKWVDLQAEILIGRASAENVVEMSNFVFKTRQYEEDSETEEYTPSGLLLHEKFMISTTTIHNHTMSLQIIRGSDEYGYRSLGFETDIRIGVEELWDRPPDLEWKKEDIIGKIESNENTIINFIGHSTTNINMRMTIEDADALRNTNLIFEYSQGCFPGNFEANCIAEHFTTQTRYGMFAGVYNSREGFYKNDIFLYDDGPSQHMNRQFWDAYFCEGILQFSSMHAESHEDNIWKMLPPSGVVDMPLLWCYYTSNLFGDPYTSMWIPHESHFRRYNSTGDYEELYPYKIVYKAHNTITFNGHFNIDITPGEVHENSTFISGKTIWIKEVNESGLPRKPKFYVKKGANVKFAIDPRLQLP